MTEDNPPDRYKIDGITLEELATVFTWAQIVVDAQMDGDAADEMQELMQSLSDRLGLQYSLDETTIEELPDGPDGEANFNVKVKVGATPRPRLVWTNDQPDNPGLKIVDKDYIDPTSVTNDNDDDEPDPPKLA